MHLYPTTLVTNHFDLHDAHSDLSYEFSGYSQNFDSKHTPLNNKFRKESTTYTQHSSNEDEFKFGEFRSPSRMAVEASNFTSHNLIQNKLNDIM